MYQLTIESSDDALLAELQAELHKLIGAMEYTARDGHRKRGLMLAARSIRVQRQREAA